jgi:hypothetical protein
MTAEKIFSKKLPKPLDKSRKVALLCFSLSNALATTFLSSSVAERSAVNRLVVGSNPTWGVL